MTENNDFNNTKNKQYYVRAGYWHNYTGIGKYEDENLTTNEVRDLINKQHETIQQLETQLNHNKYRFNEYEETINRLNKLNKENEQLKQFIQSLTEQSVNGKVMLRDGKVYDLNKILKKGDAE